MDDFKFDPEYLKMLREHPNYQRRSLGGIPRRDQIESYIKSLRWAPSTDSEGVLIVGILLLGPHTDSLRSALSEVAIWSDKEFGSAVEIVMLSEPILSSPRFQQSLRASGLDGQRLLREWEERRRDWGAAGGLAAAISRETYEAASEYGVGEEELPCLLVADEGRAQKEVSEWERIAMGGIDFSQDAVAKDAVAVLRRLLSMDLVRSAFRKQPGDKRNREAPLQRLVEEIRRGVEVLPHRSGDLAEVYRRAGEAHLLQLGSMLDDTWAAGKLDGETLRGLVGSDWKLPESAWHVIDVLLRHRGEARTAAQIEAEIKRRYRQEVSESNIQKNLVSRIRAHISLRHGGSGYQLDTPILVRR